MARLSGRRITEEHESGGAFATPSLLEAVARRTVDSGQAVGVGRDGQIAVLDFDPEGIAQPKDLSAVYQVLGVPLVAQGEIVGGLVMSVLSDEKPFRIQDLNLLAAFSRQVTAFIENARLYKVVQRARFGWRSWCGNSSTRRKGSASASR